MKIAVTGGNGYLGKHVADYFHADALSRKTGFDVTSAKDCERLKEYDTVIHMAALVDKTEKDPEEVFRVNAQGTFNIASVLGGGQTLVFASTKEVRTPSDAYAYSKAVAEKYIEYFAKKNGFRSGIFRLGTTYAAPTKGKTWVNKYVEDVANGREVILFGGGKQTRDFLHVYDLARAFQGFIDSGLQSCVLDVGGGADNSSDINGLVGLIGEVLGKKPNTKFSDSPARGQVHSITDLSEIKNTLNWSPEISLAEGIKLISA